MTEKKGSKKVIPKIFICSSKENLYLAKAIQEILDNWSNPIVWDQDVFELTNNFLDSLLSQFNDFNFGIFIFTPDDFTRRRGKQFASIRDNVLFELGISIGKLGPDKSFVIIPKGYDPQVSDLLGRNFARYDHSKIESDKKYIISILEPACNKIKRKIDIVSSSQPPKKEKKITSIIDETNFDKGYKSLDKSSPILFVPKASRYESEPTFYKVFKYYLKQSKSYVELIGSGFNCLEKEGKDLSDRYLRVLTGCASRHPLVRIELANKTQKKWLQKVADFLEPLNDDVKIYIPNPKKPNLFLLKDICLIGNESNNVTIPYITSNR